MLISYRENIFSFFFFLGGKCEQMEKYAHRRNVILGIIKAHYNIVKTGPSNVNYGKTNAIAMGSLMSDQYKGDIEFIIRFISSCGLINLHRKGKMS